MVFDRKLGVTILGNAGTGKTTLIKRIKGEPLVTEKTTSVAVEQRRIKLLSQSDASKLSRERYRFYKITAVDTPGDFTLRRQWREAMRRYKTDGIIFMLDPQQDFIIQKTAMEDAFNYFLDSLSTNPERANKLAKKKRAIFYMCVNKIDTFIEMNMEEGRILTREEQFKAEDKAREYIDQFADTLRVYYDFFPKAQFRESYMSVLHSPYEAIDRVFERIKMVLYPVKNESIPSNDILDRWFK